VKRLIVNADDLGLTAGVDRGILEAYESGIVTSATLMAGGATFHEAVRLAAQVPQLGIGCHIDLVQLAPALPAQDIKSLCDGERFRHGVGPLAARSLSGRISPDEVTREAAAQIRKLQAAGVRVSHVDTHKHAHIFPAVLKGVLRAAAGCGVRAIRNPFEPHAMVRFGDALSEGQFSRWAAVRMLSAFAPHFRREVQKAGMATTDGTIGIALTGHLGERTLYDLVRRVPPGTWELVTHPGYSDVTLAGLSRLTEHREKELRLLTSPKTRQVIESAGIELINYAGLA
jgi:hopanoid biosynthesis associated protein HpnK